MGLLNKYLEEVYYLKYYIIITIASIALSYSVYLFFSADIVSKIGDEDQLFEYLTAIFFFAASIILLLTFIRTKNYFILVLSVLFFAGSGEEISWGQRLINYETPEKIKEINVQGELTIHNLEIFNSHEFEGDHKKGLSRLTEINFLFKIFTILFGIVLPFCVYHISSVNKITRRLKVPVPPFTIGMFFMVSWLTYRILLSFILPAGHHEQYYDTAGEIFECLEAFILLMISIYFYTKLRIGNYGMDIKQFV